MHARNRRVVKRVTVRSMIRGPPRETNASSQWEAAELAFKNDYRWVMNTAWRWPLPSLSSVCDRRLYMQVLQQLPVQPQVWAGLTAGGPHTAASPHRDGSAVTPHTTASQHGGPSSRTPGHGDGLAAAHLGHSAFPSSPSSAGPTWRAPTLLPSTSSCVDPSWQRAQPCSAD